MTVPAKIDDLSSLERIAALLDARGESRDAIARAVGVAPATISKWRGRGPYRAEVARWRSRDIALIEEILERVRVEIAAAGVEAVSTLRTALGATRGKHPDWKVRLDAASAILSKVPMQSPADGPEARALAAVTLVIRRDGTEIEIEGEAVEV